MRGWIVSLLFLAAASAKATPAVAPGDYGDLLLGYDGASDVVTGYFLSGTGDNGEGGPQFTCAFYLRGTMAGTSAALETYVPAMPKERIAGTLTVGKSVMIALREEHGGCWNVQHFADKQQPAAFTLASKHAWRSVRVVKSAKAFFHVAPSAAKKGKAYVVKGDALGVRETKDGFVAADYRAASGKIVSGWVRESELYPATP